MEEALKIITAGSHKLEKVATTIITGYTIDQNGVRQQVRLPVVVVPGFGRNRFSAPSSTQQGSTNTFILEESRIETDHFTIPLQQVRGRRDLYTFNIERGEGELILHAEEKVDQWNSRMSHFNGRRLEFLKRMDDSGVGFNWVAPSCEACAIGKSIQQPHPNKSNLGVTLSFQLVYTDLMGPISPPAMGGFKHVSTDTDECTKCKNIYLLETKEEAVDTTQLYVQ